MTDGSPATSARLPFELKPFLRIAWASPEAARIWSPRVSAIRDMMASVEWKSVAEGLRPAVLVSVDAGRSVKLAEEWGRRGLAWRLIPARSNAESRYHNALCGQLARREPLFIVAQDAAALERLKAALARDDVLGVAGELGVPPCCAASLREVCLLGDTDTTWRAASNSGTEVGARSLDVRGLPFANTLLSPLGVRAAPHRPCSFKCEATASVAAALRALALEDGDGAPDVCRWMDSALAWPAEWSALHGICEVVTPVVKVCLQTDATALKYVVRWRGDEYPPESARGLRFPFLQKNGRPAAIASRPASL